MSGYVKVILVTGGSSGLGKALCSHLAAKGHVVYGTSRKPGGQEDPAYRMLTMDVNDAGSVQQAVDAIVEQEGRIDVLINNAGVGIIGPAEDTAPELAAQAFDTNVLGAHRVCRAALPYMRERKRGLIISITSLAAEFGLQYRPFYSATKAALERYSEALAIEVRPLGIDVVTVQPGDFRSGIAGSRLAPPEISEAYREGYAKARQVLDKAMEDAPGPEEIAATVEGIINRPAPRTRYRVAGLLEKLSPILHFLLPGRMFQGMLRRHYE